MKRSKAPSALAAKKLRTDESTKAEAPPASVTPSKKETKDAGEKYPTPNPTPPTPTSTATEQKEQPKSTLSKPGFKTPFKSPVTSAAKAPAHKAETSDEAKPSVIYSVMWCNYSNKKHKSWNDGVLVITGVKCVLKDMDGKELGKTLTYGKKTLDELAEGNTLRVGGKELEILKRIPEDDYNSGRIFLASQSSGPASAPQLTSSKKVMSSKFKSHGTGTEKEPTALQPRHDPDAEGAVVCFRPKSPFDSSGKPQVAVVVDPHIAQNLRPHQRQGVKFMYNCVMGENAEGAGCILADEMGLGKTLQSIALIWTLLKQSPNGQPAAKKAVVITPASLIDNWSKEIKIWLGSERLKPVSVSESTKNAKDLIKDFIATPVQPLLLITYEQCRNNATLMEQIPCGIVVCDEGHRIKNSQSKTAIAIAKIRTNRRVILSGTPLQNDLEEFFCMADFCNPGVLGSLPSFKKLFAQTIITGRYPNAKLEERKIGQARSKQLTEMTSRFILRRKSTILEKYLPPKVEQVVFCKLADLQVQLYRHFLRSKVMAGLLSGQDAYALECVTSLKKLTNHPSLIWNSANQMNENGEVTDKKQGFDGCASLFPADFDHKLPQPQYSGKFAVLEALLKNIKSTSKDKVVLVSNSKKTLDIFETMCKELSYNLVRLDGDVPVPQRQKLVDKYNSPSSDIFIFLLSSKAGGVGLNLIGGNRLVLFDPDWNPANDKQAMARIWRDGQKKPVWIYRFLAAGTIDEKIYQRQIMKQGLSNSIVDDEVNSKRHFKNEDLKNIFSLNVNTDCDTHDLIKCNCLAGGKPTSAEVDEQAKKSEISSWFHFKNPDKYIDPVLKSVAEGGATPISFVFCSPPIIPKTEEREEDIVNEAARADIYMTAEESVKEEDEGEKEGGKEGEEGGEEAEEVKPKRGRKKAEEKGDSPKEKKTGGRRKKAEKEPEPEVTNSPPREVEEEEEKEEEKQEEAKPAVRVRGRLMKKVVEEPEQEENDVDMLEIED